MNKKKNLPAARLPDGQGRQVKKIHFTGIKGVGMTPLALIAKEAGFEVTGSDLPKTFITDKQLKKAGIKISDKFSRKNINDQDLVIVTAAHGGLDNPEIIEALNKNIKVLTQAEALGEFQKGNIINRVFSGISIAGSHGKTTTSAIVATILKLNGLDPSYVIGTGQIPSLGSSGHLGNGKYFIAEADEYFTDLKHKKYPKFYYQDPKYLLLTNIDFDHPDVYESIDHINDVFLKFATKVSKNGLLIVNGDGEKNRNFLNKFQGKKVTYGFLEENDYFIEDLESQRENMSFGVRTKNKNLGKFSINTIGEHNAMNALSAIVLCSKLGLSDSQIKKGLSGYRGSMRRQEYVGKISDDILVYDDYAHHPEEIKQTLKAFKKVFPKHKLITIFQPHLYSRTIKFFDDFVGSLSISDEVIIVEIFSSEREHTIPDYSAKKITERLQKNGKKSTYFPNLDDVVKYLSFNTPKEKSIILTMGAGDVYEIGEGLING